MNCPHMDYSGLVPGYPPSSHFFLCVCATGWFPTPTPPSSHVRRPWIKMAPCSFVTGITFALLRFALWGSPSRNARIHFGSSLHRRYWQYCFACNRQSLSFHDANPQRGTTIGEASMATLHRMQQPMPSNVTLASRSAEWIPSLSDTGCKSSSSSLSIRVLGSLFRFRTFSSRCRNTRCWAVQILRRY